MKWKMKAFTSTGSMGFVAQAQKKDLSPDNRYMVLVDIDGTVVPFYTSSGAAGKKGPDGKLFGVGDFFPVIGIGFDAGTDDMWYNKTNYTWNGKDSKYAIDTYYGMPALGKIAEELNKRIDYDAIKAEPFDKEFIIGRVHQANEANQSLVPLGITPFSSASSASSAELEKHIDILRAKLGL